MLEDRRGKPHPHQMVKCPRCESPDTKFCYYNNYSTTQPRYFCKNCKRYWTNGGALRNVPVGGGLRKNKRSKQKTNNTSSSSSSSTPHHKPSTSSTCNADDHHNHSLPNPSPLHPNPAYPPSPCIYDTGDQSAHALPYHHFNYNHPGFNYPPPPPPPPPPVSMEGFPHGEGGFGSVYNPLSSSRSQSNSGETSEVSMEPRSEAMKSALFAPPQVVGLHERSSYGLASDDHTAAATEDGRHKVNSNGGTNDSINNYNYMQRLGYGDEQQQVNKWREEGLTNVVNVYDWQQISEGLFGGGGGDFFYMPTHSANWSDFDSGTRL